MHRHLIVFAALCLPLSLSCRGGDRTAAFGERFDDLRAAAATDAEARQQLGRLMAELPKGGDLHSHLSGTTQFPDLLAIAEAEGFDLVFRDEGTELCGFSKSGRGNRAFPDGACRQGEGVEDIPAGVVRKTPALLEVVREAITIDQGEGDGEATGFGEFNLIFGRLDNLTDRPSVMGELIRSTMREAFRTHVSYLELKLNPIGRYEAELVRGSWADVPVAVEEVVAEVRAAVEDENRLLKERWEAHPWLAGGDPATGGRSATTNPWPAHWPEPVEVRFVVGGDRTRPLREGGLTLMEPILCHDPRVEECPDRLRQAYYLTTASPHADIFVGIDFVRLPEVDFPLDVPLGDALAELSEEFGPVKLTLHAGETRDPAWGHHVAEAIEAGARRIGHGLNMRSSPESVERFCRSRVLLEVSLTSNMAMNLVGELRSHPFPEFFRGGICGEGTGYRPVSLNTDDAGVFETDLSAEFLQAVQAFELTWDEIKLLARNSLTFAFADDPTREALLARWEDQMAALEAGWEW